MSGVATVLSGLGSALGTGLMIGTPILSGLAAYEESRTAAAMYRQNAAIARQQAENQAAQERDKYRRLAASQRASYGASGVDVNEGSPLQVLADTDAEGAVSVMQLLYGGRLEAANWRTRANAARKSGGIGLTMGLLGGTNAALRAPSWPRSRG